MTPITFRTPQPAPTEPGWYYGRSKIDVKRGVLTGIVPICVFRYDTPSGFAVDGWYPEDSLDDFEWFGVVTPCREG